MTDQDHVTFQALLKTEQALTKLTEQIHEAARILRTETGESATLHRNNGSVFTSLNYFHTNIAEIARRAELLVRTTLAVKKY